MKIDWTSCADAVLTSNRQSAKTRPPAAVQFVFAARKQDAAMRCAATLGVHPSTVCRIERSPQLKALFARLDLGDP
jgi:hypothetical protein